jgi:hypothetical protein
MSETLLGKWERRFRASARKDQLAGLRAHLDRLELGGDPEAMLKATIAFVQMSAVYASMDGQDGRVREFVALQTYKPVGRTAARYTFTFDVHEKAFARVIVDPECKTVDLADLYGNPWWDLKTVGYSEIWISRVDGKPLTDQEKENLEMLVTGDLRFDYSEGELDFWFNDFDDRLNVMLNPVYDSEDDDSEMCERP